MYIVPLAFLSPAAKQNYKALTVTAKIDSIPRAEVDAVFLNAASNSFCIGEVSRAIRVIPIATFAAAGRSER